MEMEPVVVALITARELRIVLDLQSRLSYAGTITVSKQ